MRARNVDHMRHVRGGAVAPQRLDHSAEPHEDECSMCGRGGGFGFVVIAIALVAFVALFVGIVIGFVVGAALPT